MKMKYTTSIFFLLLIMACIASCFFIYNKGLKDGIEEADSWKLEVPELLKGTWVSDKERTMEFAKQYANLSDKELNRIMETFGQHEITFTESHTLEKHLAETNSIRCEYRVIGVGGFNLTQVAIKYQHPPQDSRLAEFLPIAEMIMILNFDSDDSYWIYLLDGLNSQEKWHLREYFKRK